MNNIPAFVQIPATSLQETHIRFLQGGGLKKAPLQESGFLQEHIPADMVVSK